MTLSNQQASVKLGAGCLHSALLGLLPVNHCQKRILALWCVPGNPRTEKPGARHLKETATHTSVAASPETPGWNKHSSWNRSLASHSVTHSLCTKAIYRPLADILYDNLMLMNIICCLTLIHTFQFVQKISPLMLKRLKILHCVCMSVCV